MLTQLKTKVPVSIDLFNLSNKQTIYCKIENFIQDTEGYRINGSYYYLLEVKNENPEVESTYTEIPLRNFSRVFENAQLDGLFNALNITYPSNSTYTQKRIFELTVGLKYIVTVEPILGLTGSDWE